MSSLCKIIYIAALSIANSEDLCGCNYWRDAGSGVAHGINQCEYNVATGSTYYECEYHDGQGQYRVKATVYESTDCSGTGTGVSYLDMLANPLTDDYYCSASEDCTVAAIEQYSNSGYDSQECTKDTLQSRTTRVTGCCLDNTYTSPASSYETQACNSNAITESEWVNSGSNSECDASLYQPYVIIGGIDTTEGMVFRRFDPVTGSLSAVAGPDNAMGNGPETFQINYDKDIIYTAAAGGIATIPFDIDNSFTLGTITPAPVSPAYGPVWVSTDKDYTFIYTASYGWAADDSSGFRVFKLDSSTGLLSSTTPVISKGFTPTAEAEGTDGSHAHCILPHPNNAYHFYLADLARDVVEHYEIIDNQDGTYGYELRSNISFTDGSGPRTLAFNPVIDGILYLSEEYAYEVSVISFDTTTYELIQVEQSISTLPDTTYWNAIEADVSHVDTDNEGRFLYVANRDNSETNPAADNMAVFELSTTTGWIVEDSLFINDCGGHIPRQFKIDPTNKYMFIANQFGDGELTSAWPGSMGQLAIYSRNLDNGSLTEVGIFTYSDLGYTGLAMSWVDFYVNYVDNPATTEVTTPSDTANACNNETDTLTEIYTMVTCDYTPTHTITDAPSISTDSPTAVSGSPTEATPSPTAVTDAPSEGTDAPSITSDAPSITSDAPSITSDAPSVATPSPTEVTDAPSTSPNTDDDELSSTIQTLPTDGEPSGNNAVGFAPIMSIYIMLMIMKLFSM